MLNFVMLSTACTKSQHKRMEKTTSQEASYFVHFTDYYEVIRGKTCSMFRRDAYKIFGLIILKEETTWEI
jgi:hypothetical protein